MHVYDPQSMRNIFGSLGLSEESNPVVMLNAGTNRDEFNGLVGVEIVRQLKNLFGCTSQLLARVDDEEIWPKEVADLRSQTLQQRIDSLRNVTRDQVMDAVPYLERLEKVLGRDIGTLLQPQCTSYMEGHWAINPPDGLPAIEEETTHLIIPAHCWPIQQRVRLGVQDALLDSEEPSEALRHIVLPRHNNLCTLPEGLSLAMTHMLKLFAGRKGYGDMCIGEGEWGAFYKRMQDWKIKVEKKLGKNRKG